MRPTKLIKPMFASLAMTVMLLLSSQAEAARKRPPISHRNGGEPFKNGECLDEHPIKGNFTPIAANAASIIWLASTCIPAPKPNGAMRSCSSFDAHSEDNGAALSSFDLMTKLTYNLYGSCYSYI